MGCLKTIVWDIKTVVGFLERSSGVLEQQMGCLKTIVRDIKTVVGFLER